MIDKSPADSIPPPQDAVTDAPQNMNVSPAIEESGHTSGSQYGPIRRRVTGKSGDATMYRPPAMRQEDFALRSSERLFHIFFRKTSNHHTLDRSAAMLMKVMKKLLNRQPVDLARVLQSQHLLPSLLQSTQCLPLLLIAPTCMKNQSMKC